MIENIGDHKTFTCDCGCVSFNLLRSGFIECAGCGKRQKGTHNVDCTCVGIEIGGYDNQVSVRNPFTEKWICIDSCILPTVIKLWSMGVDTIESCCGHGKMKGYIAVREEGKETMLALGFEQDMSTEAPNIFLW